MKHSRMRAVLAGVAVVGATSGIATLMAGTAGATSPSVMAQSWTPRVAPSDGGYTYYWPLSSGTSVTMQCWTTGPYVDGTGKWFRIASNQYPYQSGGYVPANAVARQAVVGHCS